MTSAVGSRLESIRSRAGVRSREIAELLDTTPQTVSRWQQGRVDPQPAKLHQLLALEWLSTQLAEFYDPDNARLWLYSPHKLLDGRRPAELIAQGEIDSVLALIDQLRDGAYV